jgi:pyrroloquinoline quinone biosynthesis protein B
VHVLLIGTAAGGGFPQWNCWCPSCQVARRDPKAAWPRRQSSVAVSADGHRWFLLNASPDVREQLACLPSEGAPSTLRHVPIEGVILTDAEIDHSLGIVLLREAKHLPLYATAAIQSILSHDSHFLTVASVFADMPVTELPLDHAIPLRDRDGTPSGLMVEAFAVPAGPPRFAVEAGEGHTVGLLIRQQDGDAVCAFVPGCGELTPALLDRLARADILLFDGTFWEDDEPRALGISDRTARQMDHLPISGPGGSLASLAALACRYRIYTHINNTNPILLEASPERAAVTRAGLTVGYDGLHMTI